MNYGVPETPPAWANDLPERGVVGRVRPNPP